MVSGTMPKLVIARDAGEWLAKRGVVSSRSGKALTNRSIYDLVKAGKLKPVPGLACMHFLEEDLERLISRSPDEEDEPVRRSRPKSKAAQTRERQEQDARNKATRERLGMKF